MHLSPGTILGGQYRIVRFIAQGGFGCTYEAEHVYLKRKKRYAIKEFFPSSFCNRDADTQQVSVPTDANRGLVEKLRIKFIDEANALEAMEHPGIAKVYGVFEENGTAYFVMEYIDGVSLSQMLKQQGALPEDVACRYIRQAAEILRFVHSNNRLHLDLKPANIMIGPDDRPVLIDFGVSKQYDEANGQNTSTLTGSTPGFAPPEQMTNRVKKFFPATDIYSLGATLYDILTNEAPPSVDDLISGLDALNIPANVSASTKAAIEKAMQLRVSDRPQTIEEFLAILDGKGAKPAKPKKKKTPAQQEETNYNPATPAETPQMPEPQDAAANAASYNDSTVVSGSATAEDSVNGHANPSPNSYESYSSRIPTRPKVDPRRGDDNFSINEENSDELGIKEKSHTRTILIIVIVGAILAFLIGKGCSNEDYTYSEDIETYEVTLTWVPETQTLTYGNYEYKLVSVEGGTFAMGSRDAEAYVFEKPVHRVTLSDYSIGATEVPQWLWEAVMGNNPSYSSGSWLPVEYVSWNDCQEFLTRLNQMTGANFRLPTEAEWEFAARGGNRSQGFKYSGSNNIDEVAWYEANSDNHTHDVGTKTANELGLYDMSGNVYEWCSDWEYGYSSTAQTNPTGPSSGSNCEVRGGCGGSTARECRVANRVISPPDDRLSYLGFRLGL